MYARRSRAIITALLVLGAFGFTACFPFGDCGPTEPPKVRWDGAFSEESGGASRQMTIDTLAGVIRVETERFGEKVVTTWKIRTHAEYSDAFEAAHSAKPSK